MKSYGMVAWMVAFLAGCGGPSFECACSGEDVAYQSDADENEVASQESCESGYEFAYAGDNDQSEDDAADDATESCCSPDASDCDCTCTAL
ncbi:MAG: hypothetical protein AAFV53_41200 [Myxococcota bacterium]